jgi:hypothetical protein
MTDPQNIVLDLLRAISGDMAELKAALADLKDGQIRIRTTLNRCAVMPCTTSGESPPSNSICTG